MDPFSARSQLKTSHGTYTFYHLDTLSGHGQLDRLPYSIRVILESVLRNVDGRVVSEQDVINAANKNQLQKSNNKPFK